MPWMKWPSNWNVWPPGCKSKIWGPAALVPLRASLGLQMATSWLGDPSATYISFPQCISMSLCVPNSFCYQDINQTRLWPHYNDYSISPMTQQSHSRVLKDWASTVEWRVTSRGHSSGHNKGVEIKSSFWRQNQLWAVIASDSWGDWNWWSSEHSSPK